MDLSPQLNRHLKRTILYRFNRKKKTIVITGYGTVEDKLVVDPPHMFAQYIRQDRSGVVSQPKPSVALLLKFSRIKAWCQDKDGPWTQRTSTRRTRPCSPVRSGRRGWRRPAG